MWHFEAPAAGEIIFLSGGWRFFFLHSRIFWRFNRANGLYFLTSMPIGKCFALNNIYLWHHTKHRRMKNVWLISGVGLIRVAARFGHWEEENRSSQNIFIIFWWILKFQSESTFCCEYILVQNARKSFLDKTPSSPNQTAKCQAVPNQSRKTQEAVSSRHGAERCTVPHRRAGASFNLERFARPDDALEEAERRRPRFLFTFSCASFDSLASPGRAIHNDAARDRT